MHENILQLARFGNELSDRVLHDEVDKWDRDNYLITVLYIEEILDKYGRSMVLHEARDAGLTDNECNELKKQITEHMDSIRNKIIKLAELNNYQDLLKKKAEGILRQWQFRTGTKTNGEAKSADSNDPGFIEEWLSKKDRP